MGFLERIEHGVFTRRVDAAYRLISDQSPFTSSSRFLNLGYWRDGAADVDAACTAMADLVARTADLGPHDAVLDVGYGLGDQDLHWFERRHPKHITGINVCQHQVDLARARVAERGLADHIDLRHGDAVAIPFPDATFDVVLSLESAFHYVTRDAFLREAFRVLRPGGRLVVADVIASTSTSTRAKAVRALVSAAWHIPSANMIPAEMYRASLEHTGFAKSVVELITDDTFRPYARKVRERAERSRSDASMNAPMRLACATLASFLAALPLGCDYVLVSAVKPGP